jgi:hypothetical protein
MYSDIFPKECSRVLMEAAAALNRSSNLIVIGNGKKVESEPSASAPAASPFMGSGNHWGMSMTLSPMITPQPSAATTPQCSSTTTPQLPHLTLPAKVELPAREKREERGEWGEGREGREEEGRGVIAAALGAGVTCHNFVYFYNGLLQPLTRHLKTR